MKKALSPNSSIVATAPATIGHYVTSIDGKAIQCILREDGTYVSLVPSKSRPGGWHIVEVERNLFPLRGKCDCIAAQFKGTCSHLKTANRAVNIIGKALWDIAQMRRDASCADDWRHADELERSILYVPMAERMVAA